MSKINVKRRGELGQAGIVTLDHLRSGETFRFPASRPGTVYQMLTVSERAWDTGDVKVRTSYMFSNISTGEIFVAEDSRVVVPVACSLVARDRTNNVPARRKRRTATSNKRRTR